MYKMLPTYIHAPNSKKQQLPSGSQSGQPLLPRFPALSFNPNTLLPLPIPAPHSLKPLLETSMFFLGYHSLASSPFRPPSGPSPLSGPTESHTHLQQPQSSLISDCHQHQNSQTPHNILLHNQFFPSQKKPNNHSIAKTHQKKLRPRQRSIAHLCERETLSPNFLATQNLIKIYKISPAIQPNQDQAP
jgi:hypothetical protein